MLYPNLFSEITLGRMSVKNRVFIPGHATRLVDKGGVIGERFLAYHRARAEADVGMIVTEVMCVHDTYMPPDRVALDTDDCLPGLGRLAQIGREIGCRMVGQLYHPGRVSGFSADGSIMASYGPSEVPDEIYKNIPAPLSRDQIWEIIEAYGDGGRRLAEAGLDGIELISSMGYLISQFLNPRLNLRNDEFGGSLENRMRFLREIIANIRRKAGADITLGIRLSADELDENGLKPEESLTVLKELDADGAIDYFNVIAATTASYEGWMHIIPHMVMPNAYLVPMAAAVKEVVQTPVLTAGRINQPQDAERIISEGAADMVGLVRAHICDPQFTAKAKQGRSDDIRACIACNQACIGHGLKGFPISCIQHPESGREVIYGTKPSTSDPKRILVVGGGPAGMKAAAVAAERGHQVILLEKEQTLGGQVKLAQLLPDRAEFGGIIANLKRELEIHAVGVRTDVAANADVIRSEAPDEVILATGAEPVLPEIEGRDEAHIVDSWSVVHGEANVGQSVVIWDWRSDWVGLGLAQMLAEDGCSVRLAVNGIVPGERIPSMVRDYAVGELHKLGVEVIPYMRLFGADGDSVYFQHVTSGQPVVLEEVDTLVSHHAPRRNAELAGELEAEGIEFHMIGDCLSPRTVEEAVLEGLKAGLAV